MKASLHERRADDGGGGPKIKKLTVNSNSTFKVSDQELNQMSIKIADNYKSNQMELNYNSTEVVVGLTRTTPKND
jgi:hypothetical protein